MKPVDDDALIILRRKVIITEGGMFGTFYDMLLYGGNGGKIHVSHPHGNAAEAFGDLCVWEGNHLYGKVHLLVS